MTYNSTEAGGENCGKKRLAMVAGHTAAHHIDSFTAVALIMAHDPYSAVDSGLYPAGLPAGASGSPMSWSAVSAGTVAAIALSLTLLTLGSAFGLASISPWPGVGAKPMTFTISAGIWLIVTQWLSVALGGYLTGRLRGRWSGVHSDEVFFRDTAHGFLTWASATFIMAIVAVGAAALSSAAATPLDAPISKESADAARKVANAIATFTGLSLLIGAFIGSVSAAIGGRLRDIHP